jgi:hypothetical protein
MILFNILSKSICQKSGIQNKELNKYMPYQFFLNLIYLFIYLLFLNLLLLFSFFIIIYIFCLAPGCTYLINVLYIIFENISIYPEISLLYLELCALLPPKHNRRLPPNKEILSYVIFFDNKYKSCNYILFKVN